MRSLTAAFSVFLILTLVSQIEGCATPSLDAAPSLRLGVFQSDATPPLGHPVFGKPIQVIQEPLLLKGLILDDRGNRYVLAVVDWCVLTSEAYDTFRRELARGAETQESRVAVQSIHTHSAPCFRDIQDSFLKEAAQRAGSSAREAREHLRPFTHVGVGQARVEGFASNRRVRGQDGKIHPRYSATKDPALRGEAEGLIDPWLRTLTLFDENRPLVRLHYYASHPQSFYGDGSAHPDTPGWARARLEKEESVPQIYFTGCAGNVTAGKYNSGSPEDRARLVDRLSAGMREAIRATRREAATELGWKTTPLELEWSSASNKSKTDPPRAHTIEISRLTLGPAEIVQLPGEPFVEFQLYAQALRPDRFIAIAGYGDGDPGYICTDQAIPEGGYEPTASWVGPPSEERLKAALAKLLR